MSGINKAIVVGRLGQDVDLRYTQSDVAVANMSIATSRKFKGKNGEQTEETEWHRVVVWDKQAENCEKYLGKGSQVYVEGRLQTRSWEDKEGVERHTTEIVAYTVQFLDSKSDSGGGVPHPADEGGGNTKPDKQVDSSVDLNKDLDDLDDDLPFAWIIILITVGSYANMLI